ncbi:hypothetical protein O1W71_15540 [Microbacterium sp. H37-C3]|nr:hypothetical protein [Microbacterium sp. H37-C3]
MFLPLIRRNSGNTDLINVTHIRRVWVEAADDLDGSDAVVKSTLILFVQLGEDGTTHRYVPVDVTGKAWPDANDKERALLGFTTRAHQSLSE